MTNRTLEKEYLINVLYEAQEHLYEAISLLEDYVRVTNNAYVEDLLLDHLRIITGQAPGLISSDLNIDDLIEQLNEYEDGEED